MSLSKKKPAVLLVGHGSRMRGFDASMKKVARSLRKSGHYGEVACAFLSLKGPAPETEIRRFVRLGFRDIRVLPYFLLQGRHVVKDLRRLVVSARRLFGRGVSFRLSPDLGYDERIVAVIRDRIEQRANRTLHG